MERTPAVVANPNEPPPLTIVPSLADEFPLQGKEEAALRVLCQRSAG